VEKALYNSIGIDYNQTRAADPFLAERLFSLLSPRKNSRYLDAGCGTGNYTVVLGSKGYTFYGVDPSEIMLDEAGRKSDEVFWARAVVENLPFENEFFGGALASLTIHHWKSLEKGFAEVYRVLEPGGKFVIFTAFPEQMEGYWLNYYFPKMLKDSMKVMPSRRRVEKSLISAGFIIESVEKYFIQPDLRDLFLYSGKHRPQLYLDAQVRKGISSFSVLANQAEVEKGLQKLAGDLASGNFAQAAKKYENDSGDYCFIVAAKNS
jgi:ubiquinone/menaquinone biosynthesis C-methylase UbiE